MLGWAVTKIYLLPPSIKNILALHLVYFSKTKYRHYFRLSQEPEPEQEPKWKTTSPKMEDNQKGR